MLITQTKDPEENSSSPDLDIYKSWPSAHRNVTTPQGFFTFLHCVTDMNHTLIFPDEQVVSVWQSAAR